MMDKILKKSFYEKNTLDVAKNLLGCFLGRKIGRKIIRGKITEVEAYIGEDDLACHASKGRTKRTEIMYGPAGHAYIYLIYGMYHCLNVVTEKKDFPAAVLIRGLADISEWKANKSEWKETMDVRLDGPGKLCRFLKIDRKLNGWDLTKGGKLWIASPELVGLGPKKLKIKKSKRIGIDYARHCKHYLWRFSID